VGVWVVVDVCCVVEHAEGDVARAACNVEDAPAGLGGAGRVAAGVERADKVVFPQAVDAEGHEVVHGVVRGGDGAEDCADCFVYYLSVLSFCFLLQGFLTFGLFQGFCYAFETEMRRLVVAVVGIGLLLCQVRRCCKGAGNWRGRHVSSGQP
jgi:hypothetical protein